MEIELYEALVSANVSPEKAKAVTAAFRREGDTNLASKADLRVLAAELRTEMQALRIELIRWQIGTSVALITALIGLKLLH